MYPHLSYCVCNRENNQEDYYTYFLISPSRREQNNNAVTSKAFSSNKKKKVTKKKLLVCYGAVRDFLFQPPITPSPFTPIPYSRVILKFGSVSFPQEKKNSKVDWSLLKSFRNFLPRDIFFIFCKISR